MEVRADSTAAHGPGDADRQAGADPVPACGADTPGAQPDPAARTGAARETTAEAGAARGAGLGSDRGSGAEEQAAPAAAEAGAPSRAGAADRGTAVAGDVAEGGTRRSGPADPDRHAAAEAGAVGETQETDDGPGRPAGSRRPPAVTRDTARPEGGGRAARGDAPAPARQWPLLGVLSLTGIGLLIVGTNAFADAFRVGTMLIGAALILGAVLRRVTPSVGMLAVRSRFTDMITYGLLGTVIVLLALVVQPKPWLDVPFLEDAVHFTVR
ncbi:DUF3017 domain-containing protein [Streptomyces xantholiticus]|uniref:DUF3017 domain-containing protein n=1 Tax=Streptomyces xantholiticus TaxID=68285 RepID=A0ABV1URB2_9ACTN